MKRFAIIVAGGTGTRFKSQKPKQLVLLAGRPVLMHSVEKFYNCEAEIIVVLHENLIDEWKQLCIGLGFNLPHVITHGGTTRTASVLNGLNKILVNEGVVAVHDAARPLVTVQLIEKLYQKAAIKGCAVPVVPVPESIRKMSGGKNEAANRDEFVFVQTPQCFALDKLKYSYQKYGDESFSDDAALFEKAGHKIHLAEGERNNFKITEPLDLISAEAILKD